MYDWPHPLISSRRKIPEMIPKTRICYSRGFLSVPSKLIHLNLYAGYNDVGRCYDFMIESQLLNVHCTVYINNVKCFMQCIRLHTIFSIALILYAALVCCNKRNDVIVNGSIIKSKKICAHILWATQLQRLVKV